MSNLAEILQYGAMQHPNAPALLYKAQSKLCAYKLYTWTYQQLWQQVLRRAQFFKTQGLSAEQTEQAGGQFVGQTAGLLCDNDPDFVVNYFALLSLGVTVIPLNTRLTPPEWQHILADAQAQWLIASPDFEQALPALPNIRVFCTKPDELTCGLTEDTLLSEVSSPFPVSVCPSTLATLIYTSGTTGKPKGVMLSHASILADARANAQVIEATAEDRFITVSPLFHVFGQTNVLITAFLVGASVVLVKKFSPKAILEAIEAHGVTFLAAVPTMYQMLLSHLPERSDLRTDFRAHLREKSYNLSSLRVCHSGAAPLSKALFTQVEAAFGAPVQEGYGLSEASSIICSNPLRGPRKPGSVGLALPGLTVQVLDDTLNRVPTGEIGEICVRGPVLMQGYLNRPEETAQAIVHGWLRTKDLGYQDAEGYIYILDRKDDLINVGGQKVYPREVEEVLAQHPAVEAVAVVGMPSALYHHEIKAFVVLKPAQAIEQAKTLTTALGDTLKQHCRHQLAEYKVPRQITFLEALPKGPTGKILRTTLRQLS